MNTKSLYWTTITEYYDKETGEQITKRTKEETRHEIKNKYIIIKINKNVTSKDGKATIKYTIECRKRPKQSEIKFGWNRKSTKYTI